MVNPHNQIVPGHGAHGSHEPQPVTQRGTKRDASAEEVPQAADQSLAHLDKARRTSQKELKPKLVQKQQLKKLEMGSRIAALGGAIAWVNRYITGLGAHDLNSLEDMMDQGIITEDQYKAAAKLFLSTHLGSPLTPVVTAMMPIGAAFISIYATYKRSEVEAEVNRLMTVRDINNAKLKTAVLNELIGQDIGLKEGDEKHVKLPADRRADRITLNEIVKECRANIQAREEMIDKICQRQIERSSGTLDKLWKKALASAQVIHAAIQERHDPVAAVQKARIHGLPSSSREAVDAAMLSAELQGYAKEYVSEGGVLSRIFGSLIKDAGADIERKEVARAKTDRAVAMEAVRRLTGKGAKIGPVAAGEEFAVPLEQSPDLTPEELAFVEECEKIAEAVTKEAQKEGLKL